MAEGKNSRKQETEMAKDRIRLLRADEIDVRVGSLSEKGVSLLLYKDARVDMAILDEIFGMKGWKRFHEQIGENVYCTVSILDRETGEWISKTDVGVGSGNDSAKGAASDSFKRACVNIGIGRELYTAPFIWVSADKVSMEEKNGKLYVKDRFRVSAISYEDRNIDRLTICNQNGREVYSLGYGNTSYSGNSSYSGASADGYGDYSKAKTGKKITLRQAKNLMELLEQNGISVSSVLKKHSLKDLSEMDVELYNNAVTALTFGREAA